MLLQAGLLLSLVSPAPAQTIRIFSDEKKEPLPSVRIGYSTTSKAKGSIAYTNADGIAVLPPDTARKRLVRISLAGYETIVDTLAAEQNKSYFLKLKIVELGDVVVTAQYSPGSTESSVHRVRVIDREKIENSAAQNLRDLLGTEMNIRLSQDNILGTGMSLQGISGENVKIMIDGVPVIGRQNGSIDLSQINVNNIERVELVEGPLSVNYGTNALAGVVNLITRKSQAAAFETRTNSYYESMGQYNLDMYLGYRRGNSFFSISGLRNYFDGWNAGERMLLIPERGIADSSRVLAWKPKEQYSGSWLYSHSSAGMNLRYRGEYFSETINNRGMPRPPYYESAFDDYYRTRRFDNSLSINGSFSPEMNFSALFAYNDYRRQKNTVYKDLTTLGEVESPNPGDQDTSSVSLMSARGSLSTSSEGRTFNYELGYDLSLERASGIRIEGTAKSIGDYAIFASTEYRPWNDIVFRPGLRAAYNTEFRHPLVPSLNILYRPAGRISLRTSYARGFRAPSLKELYFYFIDINHNITGNRTLSAEYSDNYSFSARYAHDAGAMAWIQELGLFYNDIRNMISLAQVQGTEYSYVNIGRFKTTGLQLSSEVLGQGLRCKLALAWTGRYNELSRDYDLAVFSFSPEVQLNISYEISELHMVTSLYYKYSGAVPGYMIGSGGTVLRSETGSYQLADLTASYSLSDGWLSLNGGVKNIFNVTNVNMTAGGSVHSEGSGSMPVAMGRTFFLGLGLTFRNTAEE